MPKNLITLAVLLAVTACAEQPSSIAPVPIGDVYSDVSCAKARQLYQQEVARVPALVSAQKQAVAGDAVGVLLIGVPVSSLSGDDLEGEIAATKGKLIALSARLEVCGTPPPKIAWD
ncbi:MULTISPECIES: hypothetical protein [unclassified Ruegeria]|uniref:hypothetical protein n=1 Tax=unclassified Ruegeria TaxID=2625375 RepID=UPI001488D496|nr:MULTISPECIES: hypothetical protein [unclassified Ruegeria]NOD76290.1 hypothetical protein [Ruegeria sp. HKCCD4332]NOD94319.1 hypothetical protein [Ruegeria sp. HKCCD4884]